ncbi:hypothetical protein ABHV46_04155 [Asaia sp. BMEF1]|uniref:hypothetical protein n=1 Tax=Asaia sp. BMEF1 TaxID=3155932 RepID=UPI003F6676D9
MKAFALCGLALATLSPTVSSAMADETAASTASTPYVTPQVDVDVTYEATGPDGQIYPQRMRWNAGHWQQRLDMTSTGLIMLTDYRAHRLSVVDTRAKTYTVSGAPDSQFAPPGERASGQWVRGAADRVANQNCTHWTTTDTDGRSADFCYADNGVLLLATHDGTPLIRAVTYAETPQGPEIFKEPEGFHEIDALKLAH